jgi:hypothetical protein
MSSAERVAAYRARQRELGLADTTRKNKIAENKAWKSRRRLNRPFIGCDGEGAGTDDQGRQNYLLFRMGDRELYTGQRLKTSEILDFICDHPKGGILVGFAFGYDTTMILRDLKPEQKDKLFEPRDLGPGHSPFVWVGDFDVEYLPKQYLKVRRVKRLRDPVTGHVKRVGVKGSMRIIFETFGFFQKSFLKVIEEFSCGTDAERHLIAKSKQRRGDDEWAIDKTERDYCALECRLLAELMEKLRDYCEAADIIPRTWNGAGKLSKALLAKHNAPRATQVEGWVPQEVRDLANMAYYGGRFEITRTGRIDETVHEFDIASAYPDAMRCLPCLEHGSWAEISPAELRTTNKLFVAVCNFNHPMVSRGNGQLGTLPIRSKEGHLYWPQIGGGVYWSPEIRSAERRGANVSFKSGWAFSSNCDCKPFDWIEPLFDYRKSIGKSGPGYPIKLGINGLYGAQAQRVGQGQYANMVYAGLTTAQTRARINDAIGLAPFDIVMIATDGIYGTKSLPLEIGDRLGQWEHNKLDGLFIVQPGLYWCPEKRKRKSRGLSSSFFEEPGRTEGFENAWMDFLDRSNSDVAIAFPMVNVPVPGFIGLKLAQARGKPELAGTWVKDTRNISFDYRNKRRSHIVVGHAALTSIRPGAPGLVSLPHRDFLAKGGAEPWEAARSMLDEQPDFVDLGIPFKDWS